MTDLVGTMSDAVLSESMERALSPLSPTERELRGLVLLWDMDFGREVRPAFDHDGPTSRLAFWRWAVRAIGIVEQADAILARS